MYALSDSCALQFDDVFAFQQALGGNDTFHITVGGSTKKQRVVLERIPGMLAKSKWFEAERHKRRKQQQQQQQQQQQGGVGGSV